MAKDPARGPDWGAPYAVGLLFVTISGSALEFGFRPIVADGGSAFTFVLLVVYVAIATMAGFAYYQASTLDPGSPSASWRERMESKTGRRYCTPCEVIKPPMCHHCSRCGLCTLKMDHHCPWINNCVGWGNHKAFHLFLCYGAIGCLFSVAMMIAGIVKRLQGVFVEPNGMELIKLVILVLALSMGLSVGMALVSMVVMDFVNISVNLTLIEDRYHRRTRLPRVENKFFGAQGSRSLHLRRFFGATLMEIVWPGRPPTDIDDDGHCLGLGVSELLEADGQVRDSDNDSNNSNSSSRRRRRRRSSSGGDMGAHRHGDDHEESDGEVALPGFERWRRGIAEPV